MSPRQRSPRDRWWDGERSTARKAVAGGVSVARPGQVTDEDAAALVRLVADRTTPGVGSRGRTYARAGQVVEVRVEAGTASAAIQGSDDAPYAVSLRRNGSGRPGGLADVDADCTCPYGCTPVDWCKHAAALAYVVAHLVDGDLALAARWAADAGPGAPSGADVDDPDGTTHAGSDDAERPGTPVREGIAPEVAAEVAGLVATLRAAGAGAPDAAEADRRREASLRRWREAAEVLPLP